MTAPVLYYVYDPMCSWCWAYAPVLARVRAALSNQLTIVDVLGGLAADTDEPMPEAQRAEIEGIWRRIQSELETPFNYAFWRENTPRRSTYPACRAVLAAAQQGAAVAMTSAIQVAYYQRAMNPSDDDVLLQLADELELDFARFSADFFSEAIAAEHQQHRALRQRLGAHQFPSWVLVKNGEAIPILLDYHAAEPTLAQLSMWLS